MQATPLQEGSERQEGDQYLEPALRVSRLETRTLAAEAESAEVLSCWMHFLHPLPCYGLGLCRTTRIQLSSLALVQLWRGMLADALHSLHLDNLCEVAIFPSGAADY